MIVDSKIINYFVIVLSEFAREVNLNIKEAFNYIEKYKGLKHLLEFYEIEHTLSIEDTIDCIKDICRGNGGTLA